MIHQLDVFGKDMVQTAIERLRAFEPKEGYYLAFSGGKDSVVCKALCDMAGVKYAAHYAITSVDPPELVNFIKEYHPDVKRESQKWDTETKFHKIGDPITMWNLIPDKKIPPTRIARYCCAKLKETGGRGRKVITGVRWAESRNRTENAGLVKVTTGVKKFKKTADEIGGHPISYKQAKGGSYSTMTMRKRGGLWKHAINSIKPRSILSLIGRIRMYGNSFMNTMCRTANYMIRAISDWGVLVVQ